MTYPNTLDNFTEKQDGVDDVNAIDVNELQSAIEAIEAKVGITGSAVATSVDYMLNNLKADSIAEKTLNAGVTIDGLTLKDRTISLLNYADLDTVSADPVHTEGRFFYDKDYKCMAYYNDQTAVKHQIGRELWIRSCNKTGVTIPNATVVYISGETTGCPEISLAQPDEYIKSRIIGITTQSIDNNAEGEVTKFGLVSGVNTSALDLGDIYLDHNGALTNTKPTGAHFRVLIGQVLVKDATNGILFVDPIVSDLTVEVTDTNGFATRAESALSFVAGTRTFTISPATTHFHYYINGNQQYVEGSVDVVITDVEGMHVIYFNDETHALSSLANPSDADIDTLIREKCLVAYIYWDATNSEASYFADERHGISMSPQTHSYLHFTRGAQFISGLGLGDFSVDDATVTAASAQFSVAAGLTADEDLTTNYSEIASTVGLPIYYLDGAGANMRRTTQAGFSIKAGAVLGNPLWNEFTGGVWTTAEVGNNNYCLYHVFAVNGYIGQDQQVAIMGQSEYTTVALARAGAATEVSSILTMFPFQEIIPVGTYIIQANTAYANDVNSRIRSDEEGNDYVDWRTTELAQGVNPSVHGNLAGLLNDDHTQYPLSAGRAGGQTIIGGTAASEDLNLESTSDSTKGKINLKDDVQLGRSGVKSGVLSMFGGLSGAATFTVPDTVTSYTMTMPPALGAAGSVPTDLLGNGVLSMVVPGGGGGESALVFDAVVSGDGSADYTTVGAAVAAGKIAIRISGDTTETGDMTSPTNGFSVFINRDVTWNTGEFRVLMTNALNRVDVKGECLYTSIFKTDINTADEATFTGSVDAATASFSNFSFDASDNVSTGKITDSITVKAQNLVLTTSSYSFYNTQRGSRISKIDVISNGAGFFVNAEGQTFVSDVYVSGSITGATFMQTGLSAMGSVFDKIYIPATTTGKISLNGSSFLTNSYMPNALVDLSRTGGGLSNVEAAYLKSDQTSGLDISIRGFKGGVSSDISGVNISLIGCTFTNVVDLDFNKSSVSSCAFLGGCNIRDVASDNSIIASKFGTNAGGGALTLTIDAGASRNAIGLCKSDAPIVDNGTLTEQIANTEY